MTQKDKLEMLKKTLDKHRVLTVEKIRKILGVTSRMSAHRYLKQLDYLTSYSHGGKYYTLRKTAEFDKFGLWHCGDIGFSKHRTLLETIVRLVADSERGKTNDELNRQCRLRVQNTLLQLVKEKKLSRKKVGSVYLYTSSDSTRKKQQQEKRISQPTRNPLPDWIVIDVLVEIIRVSGDIVGTEKIARSLHKRGSLISLGQVLQVFQLYSLEKKTPDFVL